MTEREHLVSDVLKGLIIGCERNVVVSEPDSIAGKPDSQFIARMRSFGRMNSADKSQPLTSMYVDMNFLYIYEIMPNLLQEKMTPVRINEHTYIQGIKIIEVHPDIMCSENTDSLIYKHFKEVLKGCLPSNRPNIVIMFNENKTPEEWTTEDVLLGAY